MRNILILRCGEKQILKKILEYCDSIIAILRGGYNKTCEYLESQQEEPWSKYLTKMLSIMPGEKNKMLAGKLISEPEQIESDDNEEELTNR